MYSIAVGFSPTLYSVDPMLLSSGNPIKCYEEVLSLQPMCSDFSLNSRTPKPVFFVWEGLTGGCRAYRYRPASKKLKYRLEAGFLIFLGA